MRVVICGDTHIGAVFGLGRPNKRGGNTRVDDYEKTLNHIVDYAIKSGVDAFIQTGDAFETRNPDPEHMEIFSKALRRLSSANITSIVIMGNHDYRRSSDGFTSAISSLAAKDYSNVRLVLSPEVLNISNKDGESVDIVLLPYRDRRMYSGKTTKEDSILYQEEVKGLLDSCDGESPIIAVGHNFFYQGSYTDFGGAEVLIDIDAFKGCDLVAMGHFHQFKLLRKKNPAAFYTGSMEKLNFGDEKVDKFFVDYDTAKKRAEAIKIPTRELRDLAVDLSECSHDNLEDTLREKIKGYDLSDEIVRIKISIKDKLISFLKKSSVERILYDAGAFFSSRVTIEPIFTRIIRNDEVLNQKDNLSMFEAFLKDQALDKEDREYILRKAKNIIK